MWKNTNSEPVIWLIKIGIFGQQELATKLNIPGKPASMRHYPQCVFITFWDLNFEPNKSYSDSVCSPLTSTSFGTYSSPPAHVVCRCKKCWNTKDKNSVEILNMWKDFRNYKNPPYHTLPRVEGIDQLWSNFSSIWHTNIKLNEK